MRNHYVLSILIQISNLVSLICDSYVQEATKTIYFVQSEVMITVDYESYDVTIERDYESQSFTFRNLDDLQEIELRGSTIVSNIRQTISQIGA